MNDGLKIEEERIRKARTSLVFREKVGGKRKGNKFGVFEEGRPTGCYERRRMLNVHSYDI